MMTPTLERPARRKKKFPRELPGSLGLEGGSPKGYFVNSRDSSKREYVQPNLPRIVLDDVKKAWHSPAQSEVVWFGFQTPFGNSVSKELAVSVLHGEAVATVCVRIVADAKVFRKFEHILPAKSNTIYPHIVEASPVTLENDESNLWHNLIEVEKSSRDKALDLLYDAVDDMYHAGSIEELNKSLSAIPVQELSVHLLLGFLTATLPFRSKLPAREELRRRVKKTLGERGQYRDSLLSGL